MSIEAMKRVVEAFDDLPPDHPARYANLQINALRTAIQQAEAKQPATPEPVAWVSKTGHGTYFRESITPELASLEHGGRKMWRPLTYADTHPAPGVPDDVVRDAERYRWLKSYDPNSEDMGICKWIDEGWSGKWVIEHDPDSSIDAAMLAHPAQKGA